MNSKINDAMMMILSTLPVGAEIRFFWQDGCSHLSMKLLGEPEQLARLNRAADGVGVVVPAAIH